MFRQRTIPDYYPIGGILEEDKIETSCKDDEKEHSDNMKTQNGGKDDVE